MARISGMPKPNWSSSAEARVAWTLEAIEQARDAGDPEMAWQVLDFLRDSMLIEELAGRWTPEDMKR